MARMDLNRLAVGVRLLHRTTRRLRLTEPGAHYFERLSTAMREVDEATQQLVGGAEDPAGLVRVAAPLDLGLRELPAMLARLRARHPRLIVDLLVSSRRHDLVE